MKRRLSLLWAVLLVFACACAAEAPEPAIEPVAETAEAPAYIAQEEVMPVPQVNTAKTVLLTIGDCTFTAVLADTEAAGALWDCLPLTLSMQELNGNEKFAALPQALPTDSVKPGTIHAGDIMLYGADCIVLFYETFSSAYSYTRLGSLDAPEGLPAVLGGGDVEITISRQS